MSVYSNLKNGAEPSHGRVTAYINLTAVRDNFEEIHRHLPSGTKIMAVLKADGYGHGALPIAKMMEKEDYIWGFAVAAVSEARAMREQGLKKPILILGYTFEEDYRWMVRNEVRPVIFTEEMAVRFSQAGKAENHPVCFHAAVDTGMSRIGFSDSWESIQEISRIASLPYMKLEGIFTHYARADEADKTSAMTQYYRFRHFCDTLKKTLHTDLICHSANSAAILDIPETHDSLVRAGIIIYGIYPSEEVDHSRIHLRPAMELKSQVAYVKKVPAGTPVSYGGTFVTQRETEIATIPVGYADGYPRSLSSRGCVLIHGRRVPILGRICMDQFMVDVTGMDVHVLDEVTLLGRDQDACIPVEEISAGSERFPYEFICDIGARVPRVYVTETDES